MSEPTDRDIARARMEAILAEAASPATGDSDLYRSVQVGAQQYPVETVLSELGPLLTEQRRERIAEVVAGRTRNVATVVEGLVDVGNVSAVMRTAEAFGFQPFHIVDASAVVKTSTRTTQGAEKWLDVSAWETPVAAVSHLKETGYEVFVTALNERARSLEEIDFSGRVALVFGNELNGASEEITSLADEVIAVRTPGFVQSFNISVAAAVCLYHVHADRLKRGVGGDLTAQAAKALCADFYARSVRDSAQILEHAVRP